MLYYPYVTPPRSVLLQALLYWDELSSIIPMSEDIRPDLRRLGDFYTPLRVDDAVGLNGTGPLVDQLRAVLAEVPPDRLQPDRGPLTGSNRLYYGKLPEQIEYELGALGAVEEVDGMMKGAADFLLPLLAVTAKHLAAECNRRSPTSVTVTNTDAAFAYRDAYSQIQSGGTERCWLVDVGRLLPVPDDRVPLDDVVQFRNESGDARGNLTRAVRTMLTQLRQECEEPYISVELQRSLKSAVDDYASVRESRKWSWMTNAAAVTIGVGAATAAPFVFPVAAAVLGSAATLGLGFGVRELRKGPDSNFAYLYDLNKRYQVL